MRAVHIRGITVLLSSGLLVTGARPSGADHPATPLRAPLCVSVGHPTVLSFPAVRQARVVAGEGILRASVLSGTSVQVTATRPGAAYLCIHTPGGRETYAVRAEAGPPLPVQARPRPARAIGRWLRVAWMRVSRSAVAVIRAPLLVAARVPAARLTTRDAVPGTLLVAVPPRPRTLPSAAPSLAGTPPAPRARVPTTHVTASSVPPRTVLVGISSRTRMAPSAAESRTDDPRARFPSVSAPPMGASGTLLAAASWQARVPPNAEPSRASEPGRQLASVPAYRIPVAVALAPAASATRRLKGIPSNWQLSAPAASRPRVDPGSLFLAPRITTAPGGAAAHVDEARPSRPALPIGRFPTAVAPKSPRALDPLAADERTVSLLTGARPVATPVRIIPGLPQPAEEASDQPVRLTLVEGKSRILPSRGVRTVQIDDPTGAIAEVQPVSETEVLILAKGPGTTMVRVWDERGRMEYELTVEPGPARRQQSIQDAIGVQGVTARVVENTCILEGEVNSVDQVMRAQRIAEAFTAKVVNLLRLPAPPPAAPLAPKEPSLAEQVQAVLPQGEITAEPLAGQPTTIVLRGQVPRVEDLESIVGVAEKVVQGVKGTVVNLVQLAQPRQVRVQARMLNVDERLLRELGIRWLDPSLSGPTLYGQATPQGSFRLLTSIHANINTLKEDSRAELLSAPSTVVSSGGTGYIMVGGEVPIPQLTSVATGGGSSSVGTTVVFRNFGVVLSIEPVVEQGDEITLRLLVEVSSIDRNNSVTINGSTVPGFSTKRALNELRLKAGETLVIGGLISREEAATVNKFPILADIPILGSFFRSVRRDKLARELVLFLTPEILPGPEPPAGLRQLPALKTLPSSPASPFNMGVGVTTSGTGGGSAGGGGGGAGGGGR